MAKQVTVETDSQFRQMMKEFWDDRVGFVKHIIGATPTDQQARGLHLHDEHDFVAEKAGHGTGKSTRGSWLILHYMSCRPNPKIIGTAPTKHQLSDVLWAELSKWHKQMKPFLRNRFKWMKEKFFHVDDPENWVAYARTATKENPEALQGIHGLYVLQLIEEASGVPDEVFEVLEGAHGMKETKQYMYGNPTRLQGRFYDAFNKDRQFFETFTSSCLDSPIAPARYIQRMEKKYGKDSNMWRVRVVGDFPLRDGDSYIPFDFAFSALNRDIVPQKDFAKVFGCDIARFGDDETVIAIRQGDEFHPYHVLRNKGTMEVANYIAMLANKEKPMAIFVDVIGIGCFDEETEILTKKGWQKFSKLEKSIPVLTMNPETFEAEYVVPDKYFAFAYEGEMYSFEGQTTSFCITPNHNLFFKGVKCKSWNIEQVQNIKINQIQIPRRFAWKGQETEYFILPEITKLRPSLLKGTNKAETGNHEVREYTEADRCIKMDVWLEFLGWFFSEGYSYERNKSYFVGITQKTETKKPMIREMLDNLGFYYREKISKSYESQFEIASKQLYEHVKQFGQKATIKRIPEYVKQLSSRQIRLFLDAYMLGDGGVHKGMKNYRTSSKLMADDLQELVLKAGGYASISCRKVNGTEFFIVDHVARRTADTYVVQEWIRPVDIQLKTRELKKVHYKGTVYCVEVNPYHLIYVRRNGKCMWSGNSGVYDRLEELGFPVIAVNVAESPAIDGHRFKRLRDELWGLTRDWLEMRRGRLWDNEDQDLVGQLTTPRYRVVAGGKIIVETKDELKKRGVASPNIADAHIMTFAQPVSRYQKEADEFLSEGHDDGSEAFAGALDAEAGYVLLIGLSFIWHLLLGGFYGAV
ncbi:MAG: hypothetical protein M1353_12485 [Nitrospirae bacterium]|nr:hypothetical protein [Nitrospirota bacterium]